MSHGAESIAIIGMSGRFPKAATVAEFWNNLREGRECLTTFTDDELLAAGVRPAELSHPAYVRTSGMVDGIDMFDAGFFGFSPRDAQILDPQHRQFLECAWEALEDAGYDPFRTQAPIGVYAGTSMSTYAFQLYDNPHLAGIVNDLQILLANDKDHLTTRVAYKLNLKGPAVTVGTACSTSLVATCLAGQSLLDYQCDLALAGGVTLGVPMRRGYVYEEGGIASPDGHCRPFDARAKGTVGGNGTAVVVLKRLSDAVADGDTIRAVIRGWGMNNDGSGKVGYTAPSVDGQAEVIALALAMADVEPDTISMLEAHGTATPLGDPIEFAALRQAWRKVARRSYCALGSLKSNVGHLDSAAGAAALIKCALALEHREIPASLHFSEPNPKIDLASSPFFVNTSLREFTPVGGVRRAAVSSFGIGGTNAHAILEEAPSPRPTSPSRDQQLLMLSARSQPALEDMTQRLADHLESRPDLDLADVAYTLQTGRSQFKCRRVLMAPSAAGADAARWLRAKDPRRLFSAVNDEKTEGVCFLLPGQGAQHAGMTLGLYESEPVYREHIDRAAEIMRPLTGVDLRDLLRDESRGPELQRTCITQPAVFAVSYAIAQMWIDWGIRASWLLGHSVGEYTAACLAGVMSFEDAMWLLVERGRIVDALPTGAMLAVPLPENELRQRCALDVAAINGPALCVLSGRVDEIEATRESLERSGVRTHPLHTSHAFHSSMMEPAMADLEAAVARIRLGPPAIPYLSNVTGTWIRPDEAQSPAYWRRHLRATVRFSDGLQRLFRETDARLLETGPGQTLVGLVRQSPGLRTGRTVLATCRHAQDTSVSDSQALLQALGRLWSIGTDVAWDRFYRAERRRRVPLPPYPFERQRYWVDAPTVHSMAATATETDADARQPIEAWFHEPRWLRTPSLTPAPATPGTWAVAGDDLALVAALRQALTDLGLTIVELDASPVCIFYCVAEPSLECGYYRPLELLQRLCVAAGSPTEVVFVLGEALEHSAVRGLALTAPQEYPHLRCRTVAVDAAARELFTTGFAQGLVAEALQDDSTPWIAYRGAQRWVLTFEPAPLAAVPEHAGVRSGSYLITGGLGKLGLMLAEALAARGATSLIIVGRSAAPDADDPRTIRIRDIEAHGTAVHYYSADAGDASALCQVLASARRQTPRIDGVFHAAGLTSADAFPSFAAIDRRVSEAHFQAKHRAAVALAGAFADDPPAFFCLFSSISTVLGGLGFGPYAAANSLLDEVARTSPHATRWVTVNWDGWSVAEGATDRNAPVLFAEDGLEALDRILGAPDVRHVVVSVRALGPRFDRWVNPRSAVLPAALPAAERLEADRPELSTPFVDPLPGLQTTIAGIWRDLLGVARIGGDDNFFELGGHSLLAIQVIARVRDALGRDVPVRTLFDHPTVAQLASALGEPDAQLLDLLGRVERMSEDDVKAILSQGAGS